MPKLSVIEGIGEVYEAKLNEVGVKSTEALLDKGSTKKGRMELAEQTGVSEKLVLTWTNHADLMRIKGVGSQYADLLEAAGVDTVPELARRNAENLVATMEEANEAKSLVRKLPAEKQVKSWIEQAAKLPRVLEY